MRAFIFAVLANVCLTTVNIAAEKTLSGEAAIRAPFRSSGIVVTTTTRLAGAIHSVTWDGQEFIDSVDHGRQLQSAASFDNTPQAGPETFNPTEAGCRLDGAGPHSTSQLLEISATGQHLRTLTRMAFWLSPGERSAGQLARNASPLSAHRLEKEIHIGIEGWPNVLDYTATFHIPADEPHTTAQFEALTGYMPAIFERFWRFDRAQKKLVPLDDGPGEQLDPVVLATADGKFAMGIIAAGPSLPQCDGPSYGRFRFTTEKVVKWNCVYRVKGGVAPGPYRFRMYVPIGTQEDVERTLRALTER